MSKKTVWAPPGWPFELDALALAFVLLALIVPYSIFMDQVATATLDNPVASKLQEQTNILWAIGICVLFVMHLALAGASMDTLSTPFLHLLSPLFFGLLAYFRIFAVSNDAGRTNFFITGSAGQVALLFVVGLIATFLVARLRMARHLMRFRNTVWDKVEKSSFDSSYFELIAQFRPLVYPPRNYRASEAGILVEGWFYTIVIPFEMVQSISAVRTMGFSAAGNYYATNTKSLVRLELLDNGKPIFISPDHREEFIQYCAHHIARLRPSAHHSRHGTSPGISTHSSTYSGIPRATDTRAEGGNPPPRS